MKKIILVSFMGSGSSAVTDLLSEYKNINCKNGSFEYIFMHCKNGVFDLEDQLLTGNNMIKSDIILRTFENTMRELYVNKWWFANYKNNISKHFMDYTKEFIDKITDIKFNGYWYEHEKVYGLKKFENYLITVIRRIFKVPLKKYRLYNDEIKVSFISKEDFYQYAKEFLNNIFYSLSDEKKILVLDQLVLPYDLHRTDKYFDDDTKFIVVHRDPRDVFLLNKYVWSIKDERVPFPLDVDQFCDYYKKMMGIIIDYSNNKNIIDINFEDLIYKYDDTVKKIEQFCNLSNNEHTYKYKYFNPNISINNTNIHFNNEDSINEKKIIEEKLYKFLYIFDNNSNMTNKNNLF